MNALAGTGEIDEGQKRLNRKEALGTGKMVVWEVGSRVQFLGKCSEGSRVQICRKIRLLLECLGTEWRQTWEGILVD